MASQQHQQGQLIQADFFNNDGGLNITDSPIRVMDEQATGGYAYEYGLTGGFRKRRGHTLLNSVPDAQLRHLGTNVLIDYANLKTIIRAAGTKLQTVSSVDGTTVNLTEDTTAVNSDFIPAAQVQPTLFSQFNSADKQVLWTTGSGMSHLYGIYSTTKVTQNGSYPATGAITATPNSGSGVWVGAGTYFYAVVLRKASTLALSNAGLDVSATISDITDEVTIDFTGLTSLDTTKYDQILLYRSVIAGVSAFTTGDLVTTLASTTMTYVDTGTFSATAVNVPRQNNTILDNGALPEGVPGAITTWKRRLVTAIDSTVYYSDKNKPESWPGTNVIQVPSGGPITGLAIISFNTPTATAADEFLVIFKENEIWMIQGSDYTDVSLNHIDRTGCINQGLVVNANGYLSWIDYRGIFLWDGSGKPVYCSRPIEFAFSSDGTLDKSKLNIGWGTFHKKTNQIVWILSDSVLGENRYGIKMDLRLTLPGIENSLMARVMEGKFIQEQSAASLYGGASFLPSFEETMYAGDADGNIYKMFDGIQDGNGGGIPFSYQTKSLDFGTPFTTKRVHKVIVWIEDSTDVDLTLNYWLTYRVDPSLAATQSQPISQQVTRAVWDLAFWDASAWDSNSRTYSPLVFNLSSPIGTEGEAITLQFSQMDPNAPVSIAGFSILYSLGGLRK